MKIVVIIEFHVVENMSAADKIEVKPKKQTCFADYVVDVPKIIINPKKYTPYKCLQFLGSVSMCLFVRARVSLCVLTFGLLK